MSLLIGFAFGLAMVAFGWACFTVGTLAQSARIIGWPATRRAFWWGFTHPIMAARLWFSGQCRDDCGGHDPERPNAFCLCLGRIGHAGPHHCSHGLAWTDGDGHPTSEALS